MQPGVRGSAVAEGRCKLAKSNFVYFYSQNFTSIGIDSNDFPDNQLAKI